MLPVFLVLFQFSVLYSSKFITINGRVVDASTTAPLLGANVVLNDSLGAATDSDGYFVISRVAYGRYRAKVSFMGYEPVFRIVDVSDQSNPFLTFELQESFFQMQQVVVTATRNRKLMENVPVVTELITESDIQETGAEDLADVLENRPGIFISENDVGGKNIRMGGVDGKYILILVDGVPLTGKFNNRQELNLIDADAIQRVEIVKGPSSAIYGSEAMGGVINIITKDIDNKLSVDFKAKTGSFDLYSGNARFSAAFDSLGISVDADHSRGGVDPNLTSLNIRDSKMTRLGAKLDYHSPSLGQFQLHVSQSSDDQKGKDPIFSFDTDVRRYDARLHRNADIGKKLQVRTRVYGSDYRRDYREIVTRSGFVRSQNLGKETIVGAKTDVSYLLSTSNRLDFGFDYSNDVYDSERYSVESETPTQLDASRRFYGLFAQAELLPVSRFTLLIGGRYDQMSDIESHFSPRLSGMYEINPQLKARVSYGGGFRAPSFNDMYIDLDHTSFRYRVLGNPDLEPEKSTGFSAGLEYFWSYRFLINITFYRNHFDDMIVDYPVDPVNLPGLLSYKNIESATINTYELQSKAYLLSNLTAQFAYNYTAINEREAREEVINMPPHSASIKLNYKMFKVFEISIRDQWFGEHQVLEFDPRLGNYVERFVTKKAYHLLDATLTCNMSQHLGKWQPPEHNLVLRFGATNMADYVDIRYGPWIGRRFFTSLDINY